MAKVWLSEEARKHYAELLAKSNLNATQPRMNLLHCFAEAANPHSTVDDLHRYVHRNGVSLMLPTIYRALRQLSDVGILLRSSLGNGQTVYELGPRDPHDHLVCQGCGRVEDLVSELLDTARRQIEKSSGYSFREAPTTLVGICLACSRTGAKSRREPR